MLRSAPLGFYESFVQSVSEEVRGFHVIIASDLIRLKVRAPDPASEDESLSLPSPLLPGDTSVTQRRGSRGSRAFRAPQDAHPCHTVPFGEASASAFRSRTVLSTTPQLRHRVLLKGDAIPETFAQVHVRSQSSRSEIEICEGHVCSLRPGPWTIHDEETGIGYCVSTTGNVLATYLMIAAYALQHKCDQDKEEPKPFPLAYAQPQEVAPCITTTQTGPYSVAQDSSLVLVGIQRRSLDLRYHVLDFVNTATPWGLKW
ncbi:hypothetical protein ACJZ2D_003574 [Fusarium nematophilum]